MYIYIYIYILFFISIYIPYYTRGNEPMYTSTTASKSKEKQRYSTWGVVKKEVAARIAPSMGTLKKLDLFLEVQRLSRKIQTAGIGHSDQIQDSVWLRIGRARNSHAE